MDPKRNHSNSFNSEIAAIKVRRLRLIRVILSGFISSRRYLYGLSFLFIFLTDKCVVELVRVLVH